MDVSDEIAARVPVMNFNLTFTKIFAQTVKRVEDRLGVPLTVKIANMHNCIFINPKNISEESSLNLNLASLDWEPDWADNPDAQFDMATVVGATRHWYNPRLFTLINSEHIKIIEDIYRPFYLKRNVRLNKMAATLYAHIKNYDSLSDYLRDASESGIHFPSMTPEECIKKLAGLGVTSGYPVDKLRTWRFKNYNWLEYLEIVTKPPISCRLFVNQDPATLAEYERQLAQAIIGMVALDLIYTQDSDIDAKVKNLVDKIR